MLRFLPWVGPRAESLNLENEVAFWKQAYELAGRVGAKVVQLGLDRTDHGPQGLLLGAKPGGALATVRAINLALAEALPVGGVFLDLERVAGELGRTRFYDPRRWFWTRQPMSEDGTVFLARHLEAVIRAQRVGPAKVLVLDCDNTLWGGVVGEKGPLGVELGESADGEAFRAFQRWCKGLSQRGVLLCLATKNEPDDARAPFEQNPNMVLRLSDIVAVEANWGPKSSSIQRLAELLNLGLDAFVFADDNLAEREQVRQALPEVRVVELPTDPSGYIPAIEAGLFFEATNLTAEDAERGAQYRADSMRRELQSQMGSLEDYLRSLEMIGDIRSVDEGDLGRVLQLLAKTNQWNLTSRRHGEAVVRDFLARPGTFARTLRLRDRFGDHGLVAVLLAVREGPALRIDTWLMSCRVIARGAEQYFFAHLLDFARSEGVDTLLGEYIPSKKNRQVANLYRELGFEAVEGAGEVHQFVGRLDNLSVVPNFIQPLQVGGES